jgi:hypothetical protein
MRLCDKKSRNARTVTDVNISWFPHEIIANERESKEEANYVWGTESKDRYFRPVTSLSIFLHEIIILSIWNGLS